jgi:hypothetical protein
LHRPRINNHTPTHQITETESKFSLSWQLDQKSEIIKNNEELNETLVFRESELSQDWSNFFAVLRDSKMNLHHWTTTSAIPTPIHLVRSQRVWEEWEEKGIEAKSHQWRRRRRTPIYFRFNLPEAFAGSIRSNLQTNSGKHIKNLLVFAYNHHRRFVMENKRWIEVKTLKRFEENRNRNPKT